MRWNKYWTTPLTGTPRTSPQRKAARTILGSLLVGALSVSMAWAGAGLIPVTSTDDQTVPNIAVVQTEGDQATGDAAVGSFNLAEGQILAGAAKIDLYPRPEDYQAEFPGARWEQDQAKCEITNQQGIQAGATHVADFRVRWPENPDCLYMGGYGIGPMNSITTFDPEYGLWVRSVAMQDAQGDTVVLTLIDAVYWEAHLASLCPGDPCGFIDLANQLAEETGLKPESFVFASTHSHTAMDFIGGWGAVPDWYMQQATDSLKAAVRGALGSLQPAVLEAGETLLRARNGERRDFYRSAEDDALSWFRLVDADNQPQEGSCPGEGEGNDGRDKTNPACTPPAPGQAIATVGAYAAHPVTEDESDGEGDADFPAVFAKRVEESFGGVGMFLQTGLGNMSPRGNKVEMGDGMAAAVPAIGAGTQITDTNIRVGRTFWVQPSTNVPLTSLGAAGFFDRKFNETPAAINVGKSGFPNQKCTSASPISVRTSVSAAKIGNLWITGGPGEVFSNLTNTVEERNPNGITLALGLVNDGLGYIVQEFETDHVGRQGTGFVGGPIAEYEDAYSIDHCFGDATLEYTIQLLDSLG